MTASFKAPQIHKDRFAPFRPWRPSPLVTEARALVAELAGGVPPPLRDRFRFGVDEAELRQDPSAFTKNALGLARLVTASESVLAAIDAQSWRIA